MALLNFRGLKNLDNTLSLFFFGNPKMGFKFLSKLVNRVTKLTMSHTPIPHLQKKKKSQGRK
jgi:hypothetical protein